MRANAILTIILALLLPPVSAAEVVDTRSPSELIEQTATTLATRVSADRSALEADRVALYALVDEVLLPVFDTPYAGQLVLGRHARTATPEQRKDFVATFYNYLVRSYAGSVLQFTENNIRVFPPTDPAGDDVTRTSVRTRMLLNDGKSAEVDYSLRKTPEGWRIFDVRIEGASYVQTYRNQFDAEITARGLDAVIARLQADALKMQYQTAQ